MNLHSRLIDLAKDLDALLAPPLVALAAPPGRPLPEQSRDLLVLRLWGLGNLVLAGPHLLGALRTGRRVRLLTLRRNADFVNSQLPGVEACLVPEPHAPAFVPAVVRFARELRRQPPDLVLDLEQFLHLPLLVVRLAAAAPCVGLDTPGQRRARLLDLAVPHDPRRHAAESIAALFDAAQLGPPAAALPRARRCAQRRLLAELSAAGLPVGRRAPFGTGAARVVLHPGSGDHFPGRRWPAERFIALGRQLAREQGAQLLVTGTRAESRLAAQVCAGIGPAASSLAGRLGVEELSALLEWSELLVANDTGPVHLADALGTPVVALFGPNTPRRYGPRGARARALFAELPCSPCLDDRTRKHSTCRNHLCMQAISVELVAAACAAVLDRPPIAGAGSRRLSEPPPGDTAPVASRRPAADPARGTHVLGR